MRIFFSGGISTEADERNLMYRYDANLGWFPRANSRGEVTGCRTISVRHNRKGFRAAEPVRSQRPGILFLGDSFVWGYDVEAAERFTDKLQLKHPEWNVWNCGVSGYGTDQEYLLLKQVFDDYNPRVVFLIYCMNDDYDNCRNLADGGFYKPYFTVDTGRLELHGVPVPRTERAFCSEHRLLARSRLIQMALRAYYKRSAPPERHNRSPTAALLQSLQRYVQNKGAIFVVGLEGPHPYLPALTGFLEESKIPYVDLSTSHRYPKFGEHWTPEGHTVVCDKVDEFLTRSYSFLGGAKTR